MLSFSLLRKAVPNFSNISIWVLFKWWSCGAVTFFSAQKYHVSSLMFLSTCPLALLKWIAIRGIFGSFLRHFESRPYQKCRFPDSWSVCALFCQTTPTPSNILNLDVDFAQNGTRAGYVLLLCLKDSQIKAIFLCLFSLGAIKNA